MTDVFKLIEDHGLTLHGDIEHFAELVRKDEREACAKVCDDLAAKDKLSNYYAVAARAIRANRSLATTSADKPNYCTPQVTPEVTGDVDAVNMSQERVDETAKDRHEWGLVTDDALIEEVRRRGFTIRDAQVSPKIKDEYELCCQKYDTCTEPCTPRGRYLAKREWVGLTVEEIIEVIHPLVMADMADEATDYEIARAIEAWLKEKNNGNP